MLYQLSYASPIHPENRPGNPIIRAGTLPLRTHYGTEIKVSTPPAKGANRGGAGSRDHGIGNREQGTENRAGPNRAGPAN